MKNCTTHYGTKREFLDAGRDAQVSFVDDNGTRTFARVGDVGECVIRNGVPSAAKNRDHGSAQPSWMARAEIVDDTLRIH